MLPDGTTTVGMRIQFDHLQPTPVGFEVTAEAVLEKIDGRRLKFTVSASDSGGLVAAGKITRVARRRRALHGQVLLLTNAASTNRSTSPIGWPRMQVAETSTAPERQHRVYWWKEAIIVAAFYMVYSWTRNQFGSNKIAADGIPDQAFTNAVRVIRWETALNLFHEQTVQAWFLPYKWFIQFWNTYYGTMHFIVTLGVFILLFVKRRDVFPQWRNTLAAMTALAIIGFAFFPLMPPRLLDEPCPATDPSSYGGACIETSERPDGGWGFVDTLAEYGGPWSFDSETMASISNQYAAMPSLHIGWSTWCAVAVWPLLRNVAG